MNPTPVATQATPESRSMRVLVAAGGTAGHLAPALVVADELRRRGAEVVFATSSGRGDERLVDAAGYQAHSFVIGGLPRRPGWAQLRAIAVAVRATLRCMRIVRRTRPDVILAGGGFVAAPVALAGRLSRVPVVATEADAHLGLANRICARVARRLCTAYPLAQFRRRQVVTGRPVDPAFFSTDRAAARRKLQLPDDARVVAVVGGSGGATRLNEAAIDAWAATSDEPTAAGAPIHVVHVTGRRDFAAMRAHVADSLSRYHLIEYCTYMAELFAAADLVVSRSGGSVFELAAGGRAALLVPFPYATADHQTLNARWFADRGGAVMVEDAGLTGDHLRSLVDDLLCPDGDVRRAELGARMAQLSRPNASRDIADIVDQLGQHHMRRRGERITPMVRDRDAGTALRGRRFHMLGIGGAGVSALAQLCHAWGATVDGCDQRESSYLDLVREAQIPVTVGHDPDHVTAGSEIVVSSALAADHPEVARARELGCRIHLRGELLGELTRLRSTVVVAGAHGKSTTTGMIVHAALRLGCDPAAAAGAVLPVPINSNMRVGAGPFIVEGDESDRTLLNLSAEIAVITNIERDHHHTFATDDEVQQLFERWVSGLSDDAVLIAGPGERLDRLVQTARCRVVRFGLDEQELQQLQTTIGAPGRHNALNAAAALAVLAQLGHDGIEVRDTLADFTGVGRRFERIPTVDGIEVVDDYAHHPTEVAAAISAARDIAHAASGRVHVVFQPHLFSRTQALSSRFAEALAMADRVVVLPIYGARETPIEGVDAQLIVTACAALMSADSGGCRFVDIDPATGDVASILHDVGDNDIIMTMGAGSITKLAPRLADALRSRRRGSVEGHA